MSQVYQPVMLKVLLRKPGGASRREIAEAFLACDSAQKDYYEEIVKRWPWRTLRKHGLVERDGSTYRLTKEYQRLTAGQRRALIRLADDKVVEFLASRNSDPFGHRRKNAEALSGSVRYDVLARAKGRCEACGVSASERRLDIDHILPRNKGGTNDFENLQALCYLCNSQKRDRDDTAFRDWNAEGAHLVSDCPFCCPEEGQLVSETELCKVILDKYPVTDGHHLVTPQRHASDWFELAPGEQNAIMGVVRNLKTLLSSKDPSIAGFNIGINAGQSAGQTVSHAHVHLIPRRIGDVADPVGGVRGVIPSKQKYL